MSFRHPALLVSALALTTTACSASVRPYADGQPIDSARPGAPAQAQAPGTPAIGGAQAGLQAVRLQGPSLDATLEAPRGAEVYAVPGGVVVRAGSGFSIEVRAEPADLIGRREAIKRDTVARLKQVHQETAETLIWEVTDEDRPGAGRFHFLTGLTSNGRRFTCQDYGEGPFTHAQTLAMLRACQTLTARAELPIQPLPGPAEPQVPQLEDEVPSVDSPADDVPRSPSPSPIGPEVRDEDAPDEDAPEADKP